MSERSGYFDYAELQSRQERLADENDKKRNKQILEGMSFNQRGLEIDLVHNINPAIAVYNNINRYAGVGLDKKKTINAV